MKTDTQKGMRPVEGLTPIPPIEMKEHFLNLDNPRDPDPVSFSDHFHNVVQKNARTKVARDLFYQNHDLFLWVLFSAGA